MTKMNNMKESKELLLSVFFDDNDKVFAYLKNDWQDIYFCTVQGGMI